MATPVWKGWVAGAALVLAWAAGASAQNSVNGIAFVDMDRVFKGFYKTQDAEARLEDQATIVKEELKVKLEEKKALTEEFEAAREEAMDDALSQEARDRRRARAEQLIEELQALDGELREFEQTRRKELDAVGRRMRGRIVEQIQEVVNGLAKARGYFAVVDSSGPSLNQVPVFLYVDPEADITDAVLTRLNADAPVGGVSAAEETPADDNP